MNFDTISINTRQIASEDSVFSVTYLWRNMPWDLDDSNCTASTLAVLDIAKLENELLHHEQKSPVHLLLAFMVRPNANPAGRILAQQNINLTSARELVKPMYDPYIGPVVHYTPSLVRVYKTVQHLARESGGLRPLVRTDQLLRVIIEEQDPNAEKLFKALGINQWHLQKELKLVALQ